MRPAGIGLTEIWLEEDRGEDIQLSYREYSQERNNNEIYDPRRSFRIEEYYGINSEEDGISMKSTKKSN